MNNIASIIDPERYHNVVSKLRSFFMEKGFIEAPVQSRLSILAACEDPTTIAQYQYGGQVWPLPQTGQMWLEYELLRNPSVEGFFCISTSYRQEPNPIPGRHETIFPMFEFESKGTVNDLFNMERELVEYMGICERYSIAVKSYDDWAEEFGTKELTSEHETQMFENYGPAQMICDFPQYTSPFWNMKKSGNYASKIDVILAGQETIGSAERSCDIEEMSELFHTISDGQYADILYNKFGKDRVEAELDEFLSYDFFPRYGGGIGVTRMIRAVEMTAHVVAKAA
tara:strand:- start:382 stop:1233 length:852 start_codon:yes stop_codon:yes gene_type:complete